MQGPQTLAKIEAGLLLWEQGYVFTQTDWSPVLPGTLTENFRFLTRELEMPPLTFHGLRHAFATLGLLAGMNPKVAKKSISLFGTVLSGS